MPTHRPLTVAALLMIMFMTALEATVVATAMPTVVGELGGLTLYGWVGAAYLLTSTVSVPLYGRLADLWGRRPVLFLGIVLFLVGSVASGAARTIWQLIAFRALQGAGAGAMQPVTLTVLGDLYTPEERGRVQGLFGAVWGIAGVSGPLLGGLIVKLLGWRWVFYINVPFGILATVVLALAYREQRAEGRGTLDLPGAFLITVASTLLLAGASGGALTAALIPGALLFVAFVVVEGRVAAPLLPLGLLANRAMAVAVVTTALFGVAMMGSLIYAPLLVQEVRGGSPTEAGAVVAPMLVGWPIAATATSKLLVRIGYRKPILLGAWLVAAGSAGFAAAIAAGSSPWTLRGCMFVFGLGMGLANTAMIIAIQASVDWSRRGVATALNTFARSMGGTLGVGALGGILAARLGMHLGSEKGAGVLSDTQRAALEQGLGVVFWVIAAVAAVNALIALLYPESGPARAPAEPSPDGSHLRASRPPRRPPPLPAEPSPDGSRSRVRYPSTEPEGQRPVNRSPEPDESQPGKRGRGARGVRWIASGSLVPPWTDRTSVGRMVRMGQGVSREKSGRSGGFACDEEGVGSMDPA